MGLQTIDGKLGYVVEFEELPDLPVTGTNRVEMVYAEALTDAITNGVITEGGKYFVTITTQVGFYARYEVARINEE